MNAHAVLEGGPDDLPERIIAITPGEVELKVPFRGGYEHFKAASRFQETPKGRMPVYEWWERTEIAE